MVGVGGGILLNVLIVINQSQRRKLARRREAAMLDLAEWTSNKSQGSLTSVCPSSAVLYSGVHIKYI